jgi:hypothetical protein
MVYPSTLHNSVNIGGWHDRGSVLSPSRPERRPDSCIQEPSHAEGDGGGHPMQKSLVLFNEDWIRAAK